MNPVRTRVFPAIVWKEMRENAGWAAAGLILMALGLIRSFPTAAQSSPDIVSVFGITVSAALVGLMLGVTHIISENRGDRWSFLVHRPVSRSTLFWGKAVSGLLLYAAAAGLPVFFTGVWFAMPGHVAAPFDWRMTLPAVTDLMCGLVFYFAGMLTAMRHARWFGSRAMGIGAGVVCAAAVLTTIETFWIAALVSGIGVCVTVIAARGTFIAGGSFTHSSRISRAAVAISIASGIAVVGVTVIALLSEFQIPLGSVHLLRPTLRYLLASNGEIVQTAYNSLGPVFDIQGKPIAKYSAAAVRKGIDAGVRQAPASIDPEGRRRLGSPSTSGYRSVFDIDDLMESNDGPILWYYIHDLGLIEGYDRRSNRLIGRLGPDGFSAGANLPAHRFHGTLQSHWHGESLLAFPDAVYRADLNERRVSLVFTAPSGETILGAGDSDNDSAPSSSGALERFVTIATTRKVYVQRSDETPLLSVARDPMAAGYGYVEFQQATEAPGAPMFLWYLPEGGSHFTLSESLALPVLVTQVDSTGATVTHITLARAGVQASQPGVTLEAMLMPLAAQPAANLAADQKMFPWRIDPGPMFTGWLWPALSGLALSGLAFALGRRFAFAQGSLVLWTVLGFALGPLGIALMAALIEWPATEVCSSCGRMRIAAGERCQHCHAAFSAPALDGTEILFEHAGY